MGNLNWKLFWFLQIKQFKDFNFYIKNISFIETCLIFNFINLNLKIKIFRKPENFMIGLGTTKKDIIYLVDFGLSKKYVDKYGNHIPYNN